jgi:MinD-like ATPase involved in chromosome partitioning or flagellar assembly
VELPTYTSIWRIEKRLYKLYDFRLPMPLPVGQIAVFTAITVPYVILLTLFGLPFSHTLFWLYVLPPGVLTWLATRPVLESKRLPELIISQVRYIGEPSAWCRMTPHVEKDEMLVTGQVWRRSLPQPAVEPAVEPSAVPAVEPAVPAVEPAAVPVADRPRERSGRRPAPALALGRVRVRDAGPGRAAGAAPGAGPSQSGRAEASARGRGGANGHGSAPAAFGASGRSTPPALAPAKTPAKTPAPASPPGAVGTPAAAVATPAPPVTPASAPASASAPAPASPPRAAGASAPAIAASASPAAPASAQAPADAPAPTSAPAEASTLAPVKPSASVSPPEATGTSAPVVAASASPAAPAGAQAAADAPAPASAPAGASAEAPASAPPPAEAPVPVSPRLASAPVATSASAPVVAASASPAAPAGAQAPADAPAPTGAAAGASAAAPAATPAPADAPGGAPATAGPQVPVKDPAPTQPPATAAHAPAPHAPAAPPPVREAPSAGPVRAPRPPVVVVPVQQGPVSPPPMRPRTVERALSGPTAHRSTNWRDRVVLVPGGVGPGRPDHDKRDRARVVLPVDGSRLVAVLGCTVGAGQTVTTLMVADLLTSLRGEAVAALDLNPAPGSLGELAAPRKVLPVGSLLGGPDSPALARRQARGGHPRGRGQLDVFVPEVRGDGALDMGDLEYRRVFDAVAADYGLTLADPGAAAVARVLAVADQLILVAPASPDAARALAMTQEWLGAHGYEALTANSITVVNGLSKRSMPHAEQAELVVRGRCRAIVRVPWDDHLAEPLAERGIRDSLDPAAAASRLGQLRPPVLQAYTALAGVLVAALAASAQRRRVAR